MTILSIKFLLFFVILALVYSIIPPRHRYLVLLFGSYGFYYLAGGGYLIIMVAVTIITYLTGHSLHRLNTRSKEEIKALSASRDSAASLGAVVGTAAAGNAIGAADVTAAGDSKGASSGADSAEAKKLLKERKKAIKEAYTRKKKGVTALALIVCFAILFFFKASYLFAGSLILPLGISFYTFQSTGYLIDIYRGEYEPERNFLKYALFVSYFPQIIQGPINRYKTLSPDLLFGAPISLDSFESGICLFIWGAFKKMVISDRLAIFVNSVFAGELAQTPGIMVFVAVMLFNIQLYTDFSGGIDMVCGVSEVFGIRLSDNFRRPFFSRTLPEYWRRWHISLGNWIKDYVFMPIAISKTMGSLGKKTKSVFGNKTGSAIPGAITSIITFILIGLWHDLTVAYLLYGLWHGVLMGLSNIFAPMFAGFAQSRGINTECMSFRWYQRIRTFLIVTVGEYFTLAAGLPQLGLMFGRTLKAFAPHALITGYADYGLEDKEWFLLIICLIFLWLVSCKQEQGIVIRDALSRQNLWFKPAVVCFGIIFIAIFGVYGPGYDAASFIYGGF